MRLWERICETLGADLQEFGRHWEGIRENLGDFGRRFVRFVRIWKRIHEDSQNFGRGFAMICQTLREDL